MNNLQKARIKNMNCVFTPLRADDIKNKFKYELQTEDGFTPTILKKRILVNHFGTIFTDEEIDLKDGYLELEEDDFKFID